MVNWVPFIGGGAAVLFGIGAFVTGVSRLRSWNILRSSSPKGVREPGMAEIEGTVKPLHETLDPPQATTESVVYEYAKEEFQPNSGSETNWTTVDSDEGSVPFVLADADGDVVVDPDDADVILEEEQKKSGDYKHKSSRLDVGESGYVAGTVVPANEAAVDADEHRYVIEGDTKVGGSFSGLLGSPFILSDKGEDKAESQLLTHGSIALAVGVLIVALGIVFLFIGLGG